MQSATFATHPRAIGAARAAVAKDTAKRALKMNLTPFL
jgi:hypothetical protein